MIQMIVDPVSWAFFYKEFDNTNTVIHTWPGVPGVNYVVMDATAGGGDGGGQVNASFGGGGGGAGQGIIQTPFYIYPGSSITFISRQHPYVPASGSILEINYLDVLGNAQTLMLNAGGPGGDGAAAVGGTGGYSGGSLIGGQGGTAAAAAGMGMWQTDGGINLYSSGDGGMGTFAVPSFMLRYTGSFLNGTNNSIMEDGLYPTVRYRNVFIGGAGGSSVFGNGGTYNNPSASFVPPAPGGGGRGLDTLNTSRAGGLPAVRLWYKL